MILEITYGTLGKKTILDVDDVEFEYEGELDENNLACGQGIAV